MPPTQAPQSPKLAPPVFITILILIASIAGALQVYRMTSGKPANLQTTDQTSDWKTYKNEKLGIELQYPAEWKISKESDGEISWSNSSVILPRTVLMLTIGPKAKYNSIDALREEIKNEFKNAEFGYHNILGDLQNGNLIAVKTIEAAGDGGATHVASFIDKGDQISLSINSLQGEKLYAKQNVNDEKVLDMIFSTFRFTK